jgi:hypothetical protein
MRKNRNAVVALAVSATLAAAVAPRASAATWDNDSGDGTWATATNWSGDVLPAGGGDVLIDDTAGAASTGIALGSARTVGTLDFTRTSAFSLTGATLNVNTAANITSANPLTLTGIALNNTDTANNALLNVTGTLSGSAMTFGRLSGTGTITNTGRLQLWQGVAQTWQGLITGGGSNGAIEVSHRDAVLTLSGANGSYQNASANSLIFGGAIVLDNSAVNNNNRWTTSNSTGNVTLHGHARFALIGNGTTGTIEDGPGFLKTNSGGGGANATIEVQSNGGQLARLNLFRIDNGTTGGGFTNYVGNDLGGTSRVVYNVTTVDFLADGIMGGFSRVGNEFATHDTGTAASRLGVRALSAVGRPDQIQGGTGTQNVLVAAAQNPITSANTINSLKIVGSNPIDLNGNTLVIDTGGLIQTGGAGSISDGTISVAANTAAAPGGWLWITADSDLDIGANIITNSAGTAANGISKNGAGKLTLSGALTAGTTVGNVPFINWYDGSLDYQSNSSVNVRGHTIGSGTLTKGGTGTMNLSDTGTNNNFPDSFSGGVIVEEGTLISLTRGADRNLGTGPVRVDAGALLQLQAGTSADTDYIALNDFSGGGEIEVRGRITGTAVRALKSQGALWQPGSSAGILTVDGNLSLEKSGSDFSVLEIDITGSNGIAGIDYDQLAILGTFAGLNADANLSLVDLVVKVDGGLDLSGDVFTILTSTTDHTGKLFHGVTWEGVAPGVVAYNSDGSIQLSGVTYVPEPASLGVLAMGASALMRRNRRGFGRK